MSFSRLIVICLAWVPLFCAASPDSQVINLLDVKADGLAEIERFNRKSDAQPLTMKALSDLQKAGVGPKTLIEMMRTRRVLAVADAPTLLALKKSGASDDMVAALSAYVVKPNDHFRLKIQLDLKSPGSIAHAPYFYLEVWNPRKRRQEAILYADLRDKLNETNFSLQGHSDRGDPLLGTNLARIHLSSRVKSRGAGPLELRVLISQESGLMTLGTPDGRPLKTVKAYSIEYPAVSLDNECRIELQLSRDSLMRDRFRLSRGGLQCRWD